MVKDNTEKVTCPKCGATEENVFKFDRDIYIVRDNNDFVRRKLYGCHKCENMFTYDATPRKEVKNIDIQNVFSKIAKQCNNALGSVTIKS
jgi:ribosomal protein S27AE